MSARREAGRDDAAVDEGGPKTARQNAKSFARCATYWLGNQSSGSRQPSTTPCVDALVTPKARLPSLRSTGPVERHPVGAPPGRCRE